MVDFAAPPCFERWAFSTVRDRRYKRSNGTKSATATVSFTGGAEDEDHRVHETELRRSRFGRGVSCTGNRGSRAGGKAGQDRQSGVRVQFSAARYQSASRPVRDQARGS